MARVVLISRLQAQEQFWEPRSLPRARWGRKLSIPAGFVPALRLSSVPLAPNPKKSRRGSRAWGPCHRDGRAPKISHLFSAASRSPGTAQGDTSPASDQFAELSAELASLPALLRLQNSPNFATGSTGKHPTMGSREAPSPLLLDHDRSWLGTRPGMSSWGNNFTLQPFRMAGPAAASLKQSLASTSTHHLR